MKKHREGAIDPDVLNEWICRIVGKNVTLQLENIRLRRLLLRASKVHGKKRARLLSKFVREERARKYRS